MKFEAYLFSFFAATPAGQIRKLLKATLPLAEVGWKLAPEVVGAVPVVVAAEAG